MPLLVIFREVDGQPVLVQHINRNHAWNSHSDVVSRMIRQSEKLGLRHLFIDDHPEPATHLVRATTTGISLVRKEEADPRWLEPIMSLIGGLPTVSHYDDSAIRIRYVVPAGASPEHIQLQAGITVFVPVVGRWYCAADLFRALSNLRKPEGIPVNLTLYDNSKDETFGGMCRWFLAGVRGYDSVQYIVDPEWNTESRLDTVAVVARIYGRMTHVVDTEYVLTLEDDVIPEEDTLLHLWECRPDNKCAAVAANVVERSVLKTMAWYFRGDDIEYATFVDPEQEVEAVSFSCTLFKTRCLKMTAMREQYQDQESVYATDITLMRDLQDLGYTVKMLWRVHCDHIEKRRKISPINIFPYAKVEKRGVSSRADVSSLVIEQLGLPSREASRWWESFTSILSRPVRSTRRTHTSADVDLRLVVVRVKDGWTAQFHRSLSDVNQGLSSQNVKFVVFGGVSPNELLLPFRAQYVDEWPFLWALIKQAKRVLWWDSSVVLHPDSVQQLLTATGLATTNLPTGDLALEVSGRTTDIWSCDSSQLPANCETYPRLLRHLFKGTSRQVEVQGSRFVAGSWLPERGWLPPAYQAKPLHELDYYGEEFVEATSEIDVSVGVTCIDHPEVTRNCVESLLRTTSHLRREIMIWDNASRDPSVKLMLDQYRDHPDITVYESPENRGYIYPMNFMAKRSRGKFFVVSNNDIVAHGGWFEAMKKPFDEDSTVGQTGPTPEYGHLTFEMSGVGGDGDPDYIEGFFFMLSRKILSRYKVFDDTHLNFATCEDADLSLRLQELGWKIVPCRDARIDHLRSKTRKSDSKILTIMNETEEQNKEYMRKRWKKWSERRRFDRHRILVVRRGANGDMLSCESVLHGLRWKYPHSHITLMTECFDIIAACPHVDLVRADPEMGIEYDLVIDLNYAYEKDLRKPRAEFMCQQADVPYKRPAYWIVKSAQSLTEEFNYPNLIVLQWKVSWFNRSWPKENWILLGKALSHHFKVVEVGSVTDDRLGVGISYYGKPWQELAAVIKRALVFVGPDSVGLHIATGVGTQAVGLFGATRPELALDSSLLHPISVKGLNCLGCHHLPPYPKQFSTCTRPELYCMNRLTVSMVYRKIIDVASKVAGKSFPRTLPPELVNDEKEVIQIG